MDSDLDARLDVRAETNKQSAADERRTGQDQEEHAARERDGQHDPFGRGDFVALMASIVILAFGIWWVTPW